jgi:hypothetical protein
VTLLCTSDDVMERPQILAAPTGTVDTASIPGYIEEASILVEGYLGHTYPDPPTDPDVVNPDPVPDAARVVAARAVARALIADAANNGPGGPRPLDPNIDAYTSSRSMGGFSATKTEHVAADVLGGGVWLTRQDKMALDSIGGAYSRQTNVPLYDPPRRVRGVIGAIFSQGNRWL